MDTILVFTRVLDCGREGNRLYHLGRALSPGGCGIFRFKVEWAAAFFGNSVKTIYRWIKRGEGVFWHRDTQVRGEMKLHLRSLAKVCASLDVDGPGAISAVPISLLSHRWLAKATATELDTIHLQRRSWWAARANTTANGKRFILRPWERVASVVSSGANGETEAIKPKYALLDNEWNLPGTCIASVTDQTIWKSERTISRRLSDCDRKKREMRLLDKLRVAKEINDPMMMAQLAESSSGWIVEDNRVYRYLGFTNTKFFVLLHNIYGEAYELLGRPRLRRRITQHLKAVT